MTAPDWSRLAREISEEIWKSSQRIDLTYFLEESLERRNIPIEGEVADRFDALKRHVRVLIENKIQQCWRRGIQPRYKTTDDSDVLIPLVNPSSERIRLEVMSTIRALSTRQFECFCVHVLAILPLIFQCCALSLHVHCRSHLKSRRPAALVKLADHPI